MVEREMETRAGTVALVGLPNAGKSSLLNRLLDSKLSIVTPLAQTTRQRVVGIDSRDGVQMVFVDTPGMVDPSYLLHRAMIHIVEETIADADVVVLVLDGTRSQPRMADEAIESLRRVGPRLIPVVNKSDLASETEIGALLRWSTETFGMDALPVSAETGLGLEALHARIGSLLPSSPFLYPEDELSSQPVRFFVAELIRETLFEQFSQEVPYSTAVRIEEFRESDHPVFIRATILVERASQKAIVIGKGGAAIRSVGSAARPKIEAFIGANVYLDLWVKVLPSWRKSPLELRRLGFVVPDEQHRHA